MTKQDQIADMMALITTAKLKDGDEVCSVRDYYAVQLAGKLYDAGYRKVDSDDYVSREWHDEQVLHAEDEIELLRDRVQQTDELLNDAIDASFRGAVLRLAEKLKQRSYCDNCFKDGKWHRYVFIEDIDATAKEFLKYER